MRNHCVALLVGAVTVLAAAVARADSVEFVVLGDIPYGQDQAKGLEFTGKAIRRGGFPFVIHYGDVKAGGVACELTLLESRRKRIYGLLENRVFYTPGDNEWTDCDREPRSDLDGAQRTDELVYLRDLRRIFFASGGLPDEPGWAIARQMPDFPENVRWRYGGVQFVTLHVVGTNDGRAQIGRHDKAGMLREVAARNRANLDWLAQAFRQAATADAAALVVAMQADPFDLRDLPDGITAAQYRDRRCDAAEPVVCNPYLTLLEQLTRHAAAFARPVLLVHGSTSPFCLDRGFGGWQARQLWRLNGPGDFVVIDAAVVRFEADAWEPFQVRGLATGDGVADCRWR